MAASLYILDDRSVVGDLLIDAQHREIARLSNFVVRLLESDAGFEPVRKAVNSLAEVLLEHLDTEEAFLGSRRDKPGVAEHLARHVENHDTIRAAVTDAKSALAEKRTSGDLPDIAAVLPDRYFEELKDMDSEMASLLKQLGGP